MNFEEKFRFKLHSKKKFIQITILPSGAQTYESDLVDQGAGGDGGSIVTFRIQIVNFGK